MSYFKRRFNPPLATQPFEAIKLANKRRNDASNYQKLKHENMIYQVPGFDGISTELIKLDAQWSKNAIYNLIRSI